MKTNTISQNLVLFDFPKTQNNKDWKFKAQKLFWKTCFKLRETGNFSLVKTLAKIPKSWGLYRPKQKLAVRLSWQPDRLPVGRPGRPPTVRNVTVGATRSTGTVDPNKQRAELSDPVDPDGRPSQFCQTCTVLCTSVDRPGRPTSPQVD